MAQRRIENFLIEREIGSDAFGVTHEARHLERPQSLVLRLLVPPAEFGPFLPSLRERFRVEAPILLRLEHRNTAQVVDAGVQGEDLFLVGAPARGRTLRELIADEGPLAETRARRIAKQVLESLGEAHNLGLPHGSLSPDDIVVDTDDDDHTTVRHHGLAWLLRGDGLEGEDELPQLQGKSIGAPQYAAPERFRGGPTFPADVYAVGLVLWEMLTGEPAVESTEPSECLEAHLGPEPWELPQTLIIEPALREVIHKALQRHPRKRYVDAERMLEALDGTQSHSTHALGLDEDSMIDPNVDASQSADFLAFSFSDDLLGHVDSESLAQSDALEPSEPSEPSEPLVDSEPSSPAPPRNFMPRPRELTPIELDEAVLADTRATVRAGERTRGPDAPAPKAAARRAPDQNSGPSARLVAALVVAALACGYTLWGGEPEPPAPVQPVQPVPAAPVEPPPSRFSPTSILDATANVGWKASGTDSASAAEGVFRHVYALRRGDQHLQMQVYVTGSNADANRMGVETRPPAVSVVLDEKLVRLVPPPNGDASAAVELARDLTAFRNQAP